MVISDEELIKIFLENDEKALEALFSRYSKPLYNFAFQLVGDLPVAEDIVQEVFVKTWKHAASFDQKKKFSTWIFAIAKNAAYDYLKKKKSLPFSSFENEQGNSILDNVIDETILYSNSLLQKMDNEKEVQSFLSKLSPQIRTIVLLHHQQGFSLVEIAEIMGSSVNTIKSKYHRSLLFLRSLHVTKNVALAKNQE